VRSRDMCSEGRAAFSSGESRNAWILFIRERLREAEARGTALRSRRWWPAAR
jgi:hypothetical protein